MAIRGRRTYRSDEDSAPVALWVEDRLLDPPKILQVEIVHPNLPSTLTRLAIHTGIEFTNISIVLRHRCETPPWTATRVRERKRQSDAEREVGGEERPICKFWSQDCTLRCCHATKHSHRHFYLHNVSSMHPWSHKQPPPVPATPTRAARSELACMVSESAEIDRDVGE